MKNVFLAALIALTFTTSAFAANNHEASSKAVMHLQVTYNNAENISWTVSNDYQKASFTQNNQKVEVFYDAWGELVGTFTTMAYDKLPKAALDVLTTQYTFPDYQLKECIEFTDADNRKSYYLSFDLNEENIVLEISTRGLVAVVKS